MGPPWWCCGKECACRCRRRRFEPWVGKIPWSREWQHTPLFSPGKIPWTEEPGGATAHGVLKEADTTQQLNNNLVNEYFQKWFTENKYFQVQFILNCILNTYISNILCMSTLRTRLYFIQCLIHRIQSVYVISFCCNLMYMLVTLTNKLLHLS